MGKVRMSVPFVQIYRTFEKTLGAEQAEEIVEELYKVIEEIKEEQATKTGLNNFRIETKEEFENLRREQELLKLFLEAKIEENRKAIEENRKAIEENKKAVEELKKDQQAMRLELETKIEENRKAIEEVRKEIKELEIRILEQISESKNALIFWILGVWLAGILILFLGKIFKIY